MDRDGVEISELDEVALLAYDAIACASERRGEEEMIRGRKGGREEKRYSSSPT